MPTGWILLLLMIIMQIFSIPFFRKKGHFQVNNETTSKHNIINLLKANFFKAILLYPLAASGNLYSHNFACNKLLEMVYNASRFGVNRPLAALYSSQVV